jgi:hypothetical protein
MCPNKTPRLSSRECRHDESGATRIKVGKIFPGASVFPDSTDPSLHIAQRTVRGAGHVKFLCIRGASERVTLQQQA